MKKVEEISSHNYSTPLVMALLINWDRTKVQFSRSDIKTKKPTWFETDYQNMILSNETYLLMKNGWSFDVLHGFESLMANVSDVLVQSKSDYLKLFQEKLTAYIHDVDTEIEEKKRLHRVRAIIGDYIKSDDLNDLKGIQECFENNNQSTRYHFVYRVNAPPLFTSSLSFKSTTTVERFETHPYEATDDTNAGELLPITNNQVRPYTSNGHKWDINLEEKFYSLKDAIETILQSFLILHENKTVFSRPDTSKSNPIYADIRSAWVMYIKKRGLDRESYFMYNDNKYSVVFRNWINKMELAKLPKSVTSLHVIDENNLKTIDRGTQHLTVFNTKIPTFRQEVTTKFVDNLKDIKDNFKCIHIHHNEEFVEGIRTNSLDRKHTSAMYNNVKKQQSDEPETKLNKNIYRDIKATKLGRNNFKWKKPDGRKDNKKSQEEEKKIKNFGLNSLYLVGIQNLLRDCPVVKNGFMVLVSNIMREGTGNDNEQGLVVFHSFDVETHVTCHYFSKSLRVHLLYSPKTLGTLKSILDCLHLVNRDILFDEASRSDADNVSDLIHYPLVDDEIEKKLKLTITHTYIYPNDPKTSLREYLQRVLGLRLLKSDTNEHEKSTTIV